MKKILFISSNSHVLWGGSELLWSQTALHLLTSKRDVKVGVGVKKWLPVPEHIREIATAGGQVFDYAVPPRTPLEYLKIKIHGSIDRKRKKLLKSFSPDLIVHSMGKSYEGGNLMRLAADMAIAYINLVHLSSELQWPCDHEVDLYRSGYTNSCGNFFVSDNNREMVSKQLGFDIPNSRIVRNPIRRPQSVPEYPSTENGYHLAIPAALVPIHKGQDLLFDVFAQPKWKKRPIHLNLYGQGAYSRTLGLYCDYLDLKKVHFHGHVQTLEEIWSRNHALIMGSRMEGLPLTLFEAMSCGRPAIVTGVAGIPECVVEGETGFLARAPHPDLLDEALEKAWQHRDRWPEMGRLAAERVKGFVPFDPAEEFSRILMKMMDT